MKTENIHLSHIRGKEHFQFGEDIIAPVKLLYLMKLFNDLRKVSVETDKNILL